jgi:spermidine synthase
VLLDRPRPAPVAGAVVVAFAGIGLGVAVEDPCQVETTYHCATIEEDEDRSSGRVLLLDTLQHSYVDLDDPAHLEFGYMKLFGAAVAASHPEAEPLETLHVGGGAWTMPRHLEATRPGSTSEVLEIDGGLADMVGQELPVGPDVDMELRVGDGRLLIADVPDASQDVVFGDAFGGLAAPWHLTTRQFVGEVRRVLAPDGVYVANLIDRPPLRFTRAEAATFDEVFGNVVVVAPPSLLSGSSGAANLVLIGSMQPIDVEALRREVAAQGLDHEVLVGEAVTELIDGAPVLTDDYAPIDQWLVDQGPSRT